VAINGKAKGKQGELDRYGAPRRSSKCCRAGAQTGQTRKEIGANGNDQKGKLDH
jgi:hypothetical protein